HKAVDFLSANKYTFCVQKFLTNTDGTTAANTVSATVTPKDLTNNLKIHWTSLYSVAASHKIFKEGDNMTGEASTDITPISIFSQDCFELPTWQKYDVKHSVTFVPTPGFGFLPGEDIDQGASLVVYVPDLKIDGINSAESKDPVPYWTSPYKYGKNTTNVLLPVNKLRLFFTQSQTTPGTIISNGTGYEVDIDFTTVLSRSYLLNDDLKWVEK
ncbi:hypothetical protein C0991_006765, partial [Blastosporella zonata]